MAFEKGSLGDNQKVKDYTDGFEGRVDKAFGFLTPEIGSNSNGTYIKFPNGLLICIHWELRKDVATTIPMHALYREDDGYVWTYPHKFKKYPSLSIEPLLGLGNGKYISGNNDEYATYRATATVATTRDLEISYLAIGFWK